MSARLQTEFELRAQREWGEAQRPGGPAACEQRDHPSVLADAGMPAGYTVRESVPGIEPAGWLIFRTNGNMLLNADRVFETRDQAIQFATEHWSHAGTPC